MIDCIPGGTARTAPALRLVRGDAAVTTGEGSGVERPPSPGWLVLRSGDPRAYAVAGPPAGGPPRAAYDRGEPLRHAFTGRRVRLRLTGGAYPLSPRSLALDLAAGAVLPDLLIEATGLVLASARARAVFAAAGVEGVEWLPVQIEALGGLVGGDHAILHVLGASPALDMARSLYERDPEDPEQILLLQSAVLDLTATPPTALVLRPSTLRRLVLFRADLVAALRGAGLVAGAFVPLEEWDPLA